MEEFRMGMIELTEAFHGFCKFGVFCPLRCGIISVGEDSNDVLEFPPRFVVAVVLKLLPDSVEPLPEEFCVVAHFVWSVWFVWFVE